MILQERQGCLPIMAGSAKYNHELEGTNSRLDGMQAAILNVKLKYLDNWTERRRKIAEMYDIGLKDIAIIPSVIPDVKHVYHLYVIRIKNRDRGKRTFGGERNCNRNSLSDPASFLKSL